MQEDKYYSDYLRDIQKIKSQDNTSIEKRFEDLAEKITKKMNVGHRIEKGNILEVLKQDEIDTLVQKYGRSRVLSEMYLNPDDWVDFLDDWSKSAQFQFDFNSLVNSGVIIVENNDPYKSYLSDIGKKVAELAKNKHLLFHQRGISNLRKKRF